MEGNMSLLVHFDGEVIPYTTEGVKFVCRGLTFFIIPCTMLFVELQNRLCQYTYDDISKRVRSILYKQLVLCLGGVI
ncbi:hypothetical protein AHAS_Ahas13G0246000 [Arachis hypogaea]